MDARFTPETPGGTVICPYCGSTHTELFSLFGQQLLTVQYYCQTCHTPFEHVKDDDVLGERGVAHIATLHSSEKAQQRKEETRMTTTTEHTLVNYTTTEGIAIIELTNPPANTYSYEMMRQLDEAILRARFDDDVHVLLLRGQGEKFFSAGAEISMLNSVTPGLS